MPEIVQEYVSSRGQSIQLDAVNGVLRGVKLLGLQSRNGRTYKEKALRQAISLYEGAKVNVNHPVGDPLAVRDYRDRFGVIRNVVLKPGQGLFGDLHYNPKHALAEQLAWDAEHSPENVGLSHNVLAKTVKQNDGLVVESITRVQSVDLVTDPATTNGLYEHVEKTPSDDENQSVNESADALVGKLKDQLVALQNEHDHLQESLHAFRLKERAMDFLSKQESLTGKSVGILVEVLLSEQFMSTLNGLQDDSQIEKMLADRFDLFRLAESQNNQQLPKSSEGNLLSSPDQKPAVETTSAFVESITRS